MEATTPQIVAKLRRKAPKTAQELRTSTGRMRTLERHGIVREVGRRQSGRRGQPAVEWDLAE